MRYITFSRVSTKLQDTENQRFEIDQFMEKIKKEGDEVIAFDEKTKSTRLEIEDRPVLQEMLGCLRGGDTVVVYKLSRLARGHEMALVHHMITKKAKASIISLYEKDITDELIHAYAMVGAFERKNTRDNTITALKNKQSQMHKVGTCWYGYKEDETKLQLHREGSRSYGKPYLLIPQNTEQEQINLMIEMYKQGCSFGEIERELALKGYTNRKGNPVYKMSVHKILTRLGIHNPVPTGARSRMFQKSI